MTRINSQSTKELRTFANVSCWKPSEAAIRIDILYTNREKGLPTDTVGITGAFSMLTLHIPGGAVLLVVDWVVCRSFAPEI